jgi:hypothetical protein
VITLIGMRVCNHAGDHGRMLEFAFVPVNPVPVRFTRPEQTMHLIALPQQMLSEV